MPAILADSKNNGRNEKMENWCQQFRDVTETKVLGNA
jgi:hypothetical protein